MEQLLETLLVHDSKWLGKPWCCAVPQSYSGEEKWVAVLAVAGLRVEVGTAFA